MSAPIRAVFFDAVGTLIHPHPPAADIYTEVGRRFGSRLDRQAVAERFGCAFAAEERRDRDTGLAVSEEREHERWQTIVSQVLDDVRDPAACFQALYRHFGRPEAWQADDAAAEVLMMLAGRGYELGICSNFDQRLHAVVAGLPPLAPIRHVLVSSDVGWRKPACAFFSAVAQRVKRAAAEILIVGDDLENDVYGARKAGFPCVLLDPGKQCGDQGGWRIEGLTQLPGLLAAMAS